MLVAEPALLELEDLTVALRMASRGYVPIVRNVSLTIAAGETVALVGESGAGKTMTALSIMGLVKPPAAAITGRVRFCGQDLRALSAREWRSLRGAQLSMIFQEPRSWLNPSMRVGAQISGVLRRHVGLSRRAAARRAIELLRDVEIAGAERRARAYPHELSGGMCQRVMIAVALACSPRLLIADEPTAALDVTVQSQILDLLMRLRQARGTAILFVTHDLGVAGNIADRLIVMYGGHVVEQGPTGATLAEPHHPYTAALLAAVPRDARQPGLEAEVVGHGSGPGTRASRLATIPGVPAAPWSHPAGCSFHERCAHADLPRCGVVAPELRLHDGGREARCLRSAELDLAAPRGSKT